MLFGFRFGREFGKVFVWSISFRVVLGWLFYTLLRANVCEVEARVDSVVCTPCYDSDALWGLGDIKCPFSAEKVGGYITRSTGKSEVGGLTSFCQKFRDEFKRKCYVSEANEIPKAEKVVGTGGGRGGEYHQIRPTSRVMHS